MTDTSISNKSSTASDRSVGSDSHRSDSGDMGMPRFNALPSWQGDTARHQAVLGQVSPYGELIQILSLQADGLEQLRLRLEAQRDRLLHFQVDSLEQGTTEISEQIVQVVAFEKKRYEWTARHIGGKSASLNAIARSAPQPEQGRIEDLGKKLRGLTRAVSSLNAHNADLMKSGVGIVEGMLNLYRHALSPLPIYDRTKVVPTAGRGGAMVNATL